MSGQASRASRGVLYSLMTTTSLIDLTIFTVAPFRCPNHNHNSEALEAFRRWSVFGFPLHRSSIPPTQAMERDLYASAEAHR
jgi:hypothetical protein